MLFLSAFFVFLRLVGTDAGAAPPSTVCARIRRTIQDGLHIPASVVVLREITQGAYGNKQGLERWERALGGMSE